MKYLWRMCVFCTVAVGINPCANAHTSPIENGTTELVQDAWILATNIYVGKTTSYNSLIITNSGSLVNEGFSYIGYEESSDNNSVVLTGPSARWTSNGLQVGAKGSYNELSILNGAKFTGSSSGFYSTLGNNQLSAYNSMLVDGVGTEWTANLIIMASGSHNDIVVSGGANVISTWSLVLGARSTANYNTFTAEGAGTLVDLDDEICMGIYWWDWRGGGSFSPRGVGSRVSVLSGATCNVGGWVVNWNYSTVEVGENAILSASDYAMDNTSDLIITCADNPSDSGKLVLSGGVSVSGDLMVNVELGATLGAGYSVDLIDGAISGTFSSITLPDLPPHLSWNTSLLYSDGILTVSIEDTDGDGIADPWEVDHFGSINNCTATVDSDGDGQDNYSEYIAGTDPHLATSFLKLTIDISDDGCVLGWEPVEYRVYNLEWTPNISTIPFTNIMSGLSFPQGNWTDTNNPSVHGYYRLSVEMN